MAANKIVVLFPGRNYSCDKPLLYYAAKVFAGRGYEVVRLKYNYRLRGDKNDIGGLIKEAQEYVMEELARLDFSSYDDVVFVSKSMGTALAGEAAKELGVRARHIFLTPVGEALKYIKRGECIVISGKEDRILDSRRLRIYCVEQDIALKQFDDVGHSLEHVEDINVTFAILIVIVRMYMAF